MTTLHPLGRNREHDPRSRRFAAPKLAITKTNVIHTLNAPHLNQGQLGSCEGNTAAEFLSCSKALRNRFAYWRKQHARSVYAYPKEDQAVRLYSVATSLDNDGIPGIYPPEDTGTSGVGIAKALQQAGALLNYNWTFTFNDFLATLESQPIMLGTNWYESMFEHDWSGYVITPGRADEPIGGHAYLAYALDWTHERVGCTNHWVDDDGTPWGVKIGGHQGSFWIRFPFLQRLLIDEQGESLVPVLM